MELIVYIALTCFHNADPTWTRSNGCSHPVARVFETAEECQKVADRINNGNPPLPSGDTIVIKCFKRTSEIATLEPVR